MAEQRVLYLVGGPRPGAAGAVTPGTMNGRGASDDGYTTEDGYGPWGQSEVELGGGRTPTGKAVEIVRAEREGSFRTGADSASLRL